MFFIYHIELWVQRKWCHCG